MSAPPRLAPATVERLNREVERPGYDRDAQGIGIVHLGIGAFHRAHQAVFTDDAMAAGDRDWGIAGVSLRSAAVRDSLVPQDGLYLLDERAPAGDLLRLVGAVRQVLVAPEQPAELTALIAAATTRVVTLTVTEKAYFRSGEGIDLTEAEAAGNSIYAVLARGLAERQAQGLAGLSLVSCDNLANNGAVLARGMSAWLEKHAPALRRWFEAECACPATMVDRIVPATTPADRDRIAAAAGVRDEAAVVTEPFRQWVIEDRFAGPRPGWEKVGAELVADVAPFEAAKLRMLNGAHSALAYLGLLAGHRFVHQAIADPAIAPVVERLMRQEAATSLTPAPGQDLGAYADALLARFGNHALPHSLAQIATDGSQKIPQRWLEPLAVNAGQGRASPATLRALAAFLLHVRGDGAPVNDPMAERLAACWAEAGRDGIVAAVLGPGGVLASDWVPSEADRRTIEAAMRELAGS
ncbi:MULTISPECIES: mannitol dehydrogenase family protein [Sphingomonas]|uniref:mannitol dehydrogenase family protein n=1 Tax=Sphingomonas TaxID=13687 RepID=UPI0014457A41|nr:MULTISPECIES: mannitol dehydrogenase family protein [Sphingomonas]